MLEMIDRLTAEICRMDKEAERLYTESYPETKVLRQVKAQSSWAKLGASASRRQQGR